MFMLYISAGLIALGAVFMLVFLKALTRESGADRLHHGNEYPDRDLPLEAAEPYHRHDRAA